MEVMITKEFGKIFDFSSAQIYSYFLTLKCFYMLAKMYNWMKQRFRLSKKNKKAFDPENPFLIL